MTEAAQQGSRGTRAETFHGTDAEWRTVRQSRQAANGQKTASGRNSQSVLLYQHSRPQDDPAVFPAHAHGLSGFASAHPKTAGSSSGRRSTATLTTAPTATNGQTAQTTARKEKRRPRTAWELRELVQPLSVHRRRRPKRLAEQRYYPALVEFVYASRFVTGGQIQRRFPQWLTSPRTTQRHLENLTGRGYLATAHVRSTSPHFPLVYFATGRGVRLLRETYREHGVRWDGTATEERKTRGQGLDSVLHELAISEVQLAIQQTIERRDDLQLLWSERRYFRTGRQLTFPDGGSTTRLIPDAGFLAAMTTPVGERTLLPLHFLELDNGSASVAKLRSKYEAYAAWATSEGETYLKQLYRRYGHETDRPTFRLLTVAHNKYDPAGDERRLLDLLTQALDLPRAMRQRIWLATAADLARHQLDEAPLAASIWYRAADARKWLPAYREYTAGLSRTRGSKPYARQRAFVKEKLEQMPRHPLFPLPDRSPANAGSTESVN